MNKDQLNKILISPLSLSDEDTVKLEELANNFPYCQIAHILIAKSAYDNDNMLVHQKLKKASLYTTDRKQLKKFIHLKPEKDELQTQTIPTAETTEYKSEEQIVEPQVNNTEESIDNSSSYAEITENKNEEQIVEPQENNTEESIDNSASHAEITENKNEEQVVKPQENDTEESIDNSSSYAEITENKSEEQVIEPQENDNEESIHNSSSYAEITENKSEEQVVELQKNDTEESIDNSSPYAEVTENKSEEQVVDLQENDNEEPIDKSASHAEITENKNEEQELNSENTDSYRWGFTTPEKRPDIEDEELSATLLEFKRTREKAQRALLEQNEEPSTSNEIKEVENDDNITPSSLDKETKLRHSNDKTESPSSLTSNIEGKNNIEDTEEETSNELVLEEETSSSITDQKSEPNTSTQEDSIDSIKNTEEVNKDISESTKEPTVEIEREPQSEEIISAIKKAPRRKRKKSISDELDSISNELAKHANDDKLDFQVETTRLGEALQEKKDSQDSSDEKFHPEFMLEYLSSLKANKLRKKIEHTDELDIIDKFIQEEPRISPLKKEEITQSTEDLAASSIKPKTNFVTENMAKINMKQGNYKKAISIYEQLILKFPEKKSYFVEQIEKLNELR